jgi:hypothetical protein
MVFGMFFVQFVLREDWSNVAGVLRTKALVQSFVEGSGTSPGKPAR